MVFTGHARSPTRSGIETVALAIVASRKTFEDQMAIFRALGAAPSDPKPPGVRIRAG